MRWWQLAAGATVGVAVLVLATLSALREVDVLRWGASSAVLNRIEALENQRRQVGAERAAAPVLGVEIPQEAPRTPRSDEDGAGGRPPGGGLLAQLERVVDEDTIDVRIGSAGGRVRLIGMDTPERGQPGHAEARARLETLLTGVALYLEADTTERDRYDRLLRYVWTLDDAGAWTLVNLTLVAEEHARAYPFPPDEKYAERSRRGAGYLIAWGLRGEPTPPVTKRGGATKRNS